jgi:hypothetical protein
MILVKPKLVYFYRANSIRDEDTTLEHTHLGRETVSGKLCQFARLHAVHLAEQPQKQRDIKNGEMR